MPYLALPGCQLYYEVTGDGPPLLFAHGVGGNHLSWWQQVPYFKDRYTCITFSHRAFGLSTAPAGADPDLHVSDLAALIEHLGLHDVALVAQSMGGWTCLGYALQRPERVRALVMCDSIGSLLHPEAERHLAALPRRESLPAGVHPAAGERMAREQPALQYLYQQISGLNVGVGDVRPMRRRLKELRNTPAELVAALRLPLLCLAGDEDIVIAPEAVAVLARLVPGARLELVPAAGHSVYFERADAFNRLVGEFLAGVGA